MLLLMLLLLVLLSLLLLPLLLLLLPLMVLPQLLKLLLLVPLVRLLPCSYQCVLFLYPPKQQLVSRRIAHVGLVGNREGTHEHRPW